MKNLSLIVLLQIIVFFSFSSEVEGSVIKVFSWWHSAQAKAFALVVDSNKSGTLKWRAKCHFSKTSLTAKSSRSFIKKGSVRVGKYGFTYTVRILWSNRGETGTCYLHASFGRNVISRTFNFTNLGNPPITTSIRFQKSWRKFGRQLKIIVRIRTNPYSRVRWSLRCRFSRRSYGISTRTKTKSGQFRVGRWRFKAKWFLLSRWSTREKGTCTIKIRIGHLTKIIRHTFR